MQLKITHIFELGERTRGFIHDFMERIGVSRKPRLVFTRIKLDSVVLKGEITMASMKEGQQFTLLAEPRSANNNPAPIQAGSAVWSSSNEAVAAVLVDPSNELAATVRAVGVGESLITLKVDGDTDEGDTLEITGVEAVVVTAGNAVGLDLRASTPVDVPVLVP